MKQLFNYGIIHTNSKKIGYLLNIESIINSVLIYILTAINIDKLDLKLFGIQFTN